MEKKDRVTAAQAETAAELDALLPAILDPALLTACSPPVPQQTESQRIGN